MYCLSYSLLTVSLSASAATRACLNRLFGSVEVVGLYSALGHCNHHYYGLYSVVCIASLYIYAHFTILIPVYPLSCSNNVY